METPHAFPNTGAIEFEADGTEYELKLGAASAIPATFMPEAFFDKEVFYQRDIPDCGANAGAFAAGYLDEDPAQEYSPDYQWIDIKSFDGFPLDAGTDMKSIFKSLQKGSLPYFMLPEKTSLGLSEFSSPLRVLNTMKIEASKHTIAGYGFHTETLSFAGLKNLIYTNKAVVVLIRMGDEFWTKKNGVSSWAEKDILPLRPATSILSGHFIVLGAYDANRIYFANWWSKDWGRAGYGYFEQNYLKQITQVGTIVDSIGKVSVPAFTRDLTVGSTGADVTALQRWLNAHGYPVAAVPNAGSTGHETNYFGEATRAAVARLQTIQGFAPTAGYFGPMTRTYVNAHA